KFTAYKQELGALLRPAPAGKARSAKARQQREAALGQFLKRFEDLFRKALTDARVDVARVAAVLSKAFGGGLRFTSTGPRAFVAGSGKKKVVAAPKALKPVVLKPPYKVPGVSAAASMGNKAIDLGSTLDEKTGKVELVADAGPGSTLYAFGLLGKAVKVPAGVTQLEVKATVSLRLSYAVVGEDVMIYGGLQLQAVGPDGADQTEEKELKYVDMALGGGETFRTSGPDSITGVFPIPSTGGEYIIRAGGQVNAWVAVDGE